LHLKLIENQEPILFHIIESLYLANSLETQFELLNECASYMLDSIGGLWKEKEVIFHLLPDGKNDEQEQNRILKTLLNK
jgi:hypothetical protein